MIPTITTNRLILRPLQPADALTLHRIYQTEGVLRYFPNPNPPAIEKVERFIIEQQQHWEAYGYGNWGIVPGDKEEIIGWAGLQFLPELNETEAGYLLDKPFWGKGYATEAARASLQFGFDHFVFSRLIALVHPENIASQHVLI
jgi:ribosomal-protein-alanine N-acetyltransferase